MSDHIMNVPPNDEIPLLDQTPLVEEATTDERDERRNVDNHSVEIKETNGQDRSGPQTNKSVSQIIDEKIKDLDISLASTIFKVSARLRESNPDSFTPKVISIGPYHTKRPEFRGMEKYKLLYLRRFLQRKEGIDVESCIRELEKLKDEALKCYDDAENLDRVIIEKFSEMLLYDGCFVVEYIRECCGMMPDGEDLIIPNGSVDYQVLRDLLLLENQLPFFVLTKLHDMTIVMDRGQMPFAAMVIKAFDGILPQMRPAFLQIDIRHLVQVVRMSCLPSRKIEHCIQKDKDPPVWHAQMPNATELCEAGVRFSKVRNLKKRVEEKHLTDSTSLFGIKFENGLMEIPTFEVHDDTESTLRNIIAYEQYSYDMEPKYFSDYAAFMDRLIDSDKDVTLLRQEGIIINNLGEDREVASIFNKLGPGVATSRDFYYQEECSKAIQHCEKPWNRKMANLRRNYFNSPWAGVSTVAAIILLLLTVAQTVVSIVSVLK